MTFQGGWYFAPLYAKVMEKESDEPVEDSEYGLWFMMVWPDFCYFMIIQATCSVL